MAALIARTLVGNARRMWRGIGILTVTWRFNIWAVEKLRAKEEDKEKQARIMRAEDGKRVRLFSEFMDQFLKECCEVRKTFSKEEYEALKASIEKKDKKASAAEEEKFVSDFGSDKSLNPYKAELESGYQKTAYMGEKLRFQDTKKNSGHNDLVA